MGAAAKIARMDSSSVLWPDLIAWLAEKEAAKKDKGGNADSHTRRRFLEYLDGRSVSEFLDRTTQKVESLDKG